MFPPCVISLLLDLTIHFFSCCSPILGLPVDTISIQKVPFYEKKCVKVLNVTSLPMYSDDISVLIWEWPYLRMEVDILREGGRHIF